MARRTTLLRSHLGVAAPGEQLAGGPNQPGACRLGLLGLLAPPLNAGDRRTALRRLDMHAVCMLDTYSLYVKADGGERDRRGRLCGAVRGGLGGGRTGRSVRR